MKLVRKASNGMIIPPEKEVKIDNTYVLTFIPRTRKKTKQEKDKEELEYKYNILLKLYLNALKDKETTTKLRSKSLQGNDDEILKVAIDNWRKAGDAVESTGKQLGKATLNKYKGTKLEETFNTKFGSTPEESRLYLILNHAREDSFGQDALDYLTSYINSKGFDRVLNNQQQWYDKRHPYRKYWVSSGAKETKEDYLKSLKNPPTVITLNNPAMLGVYRPDVHTAFVGTGSLETSPAELVVAHELAHGLDQSFFKPGLLEALDLNQNTNLSPYSKVNAHDSDPREKHADLWGLRYTLFKNGIYDSRSDKDVTPEQIKQLRELYPKWRTMKLMSDEEIARQLNLVVQNDNSTLNEYLKTGGNIKLYRKGNTIDKEYENSRYPLPTVVINGYRKEDPPTGDENDNILKWLKEAVIGASIAENPAVLTASGWRNKDNEWVQDQQNTDETRRLRKHLSDIGSYGFFRSIPNKYVRFISRGIYKGLTHNGFWQGGVDHISYDENNASNDKLKLIPKHEINK